MRVIKNSEELAKLVDGHKDLILQDEDVRIEFRVKEDELRDIVCGDLYLGNDEQTFDFNGRDFKGWDFNGGNFNGWDFNGGNFNGGDFNGGNFNGGDFNGGDFNGRDFNGGDFNGRDFNGGNFKGNCVSYYAFFNCTGSITCKSIEGKRTPHNPPVSLSGEINITG